jgi:hypothetical protein
MAEVLADDFNMLGGALTDLYAEARPRPDLGTGRVATFLGRMVRPGEGLAGILARQPAETPDAEGMGGIGAILAGGAPAVRRIGSKIFRDAPAPTVAPWQEVLSDLIARGEPLRRSAMRPAIKTASGVVVGDVAGGHGRLWESISPAQQKGAIDGYVDAAGRFMTRDEGTIASGSIEGIKRALQNSFLLNR